jgi:hypothetical protein
MIKQNVFKNLEVTSLKDWLALPDCFICQRLKEALSLTPPWRGVLSGGDANRFNGFYNLSGTPINL